MAKCNFNDCSLDAIENSDKCILHCSKGDYTKDSLKHNFLESFTDTLIDYILDKIHEYKKENEFPDKVRLKVYLNGTDKERYRVNEISSFLKSKEIVFASIIFPDHKSSDTNDYEKVLDKIGGVRFDLCEFYSSNLNLRNTEVFFQQCIFHKNWYLHNHKVLENDRNVLYLSCKFREDVSTMFELNEKPELVSPIFSDCYLEKNLIIEEVVFKNRLFMNTEYKPLFIKNISLYKCTFEDKFILNNYIIEKFTSTDSFFNEKVEFKNNKVTNFEVNNTNFSKLVDCYNTNYQKFQIKKSIFDDFVNFEKCEFGSNKDPINKEYVAVFRYATMMSFINFRHAKFHSGLDLEHINLKEPPNFHNAVVSSHNSNRETFRIIKYSFDKVGNYIEANEFYEMEMTKLKEELKLQKKKAPYILLRTYELTSEYGKNYIRPIILTITFSCIYWLFILGYENNLLYSIYPPFNSYIECISDIFDPTPSL